MLLSSSVYSKGNMMHFSDSASSHQEFSWQWVKNPVTCTKYLVPVTVRCISV